MNRNVTILISILFFFVLPYLYKYKMDDGMEKIDLYFIWLVGMAGWVGLRFDSWHKSDLILAIGVLLLSITSFAIIKSDADSYKVLITLFFSLGIYYYISQRHVMMPVILVTLVPSFLFQVAFGWWQFYHFDGDPLMIKGHFYNSGYFANWLAPCIIIIMVQVFNTYQRYTIPIKGLIVLISLISLILLLATNARAAIFGFLVGTLLYIYLENREVIQRKFVRTFWISVLVVTVVMTYFFLLIKRDSAIGRITIYRVTRNMISDHLFFGVGADRFQVYYNLYQAQYFQSNELPIKTQLIAGNTFEAFNSILQLLAEYGFLGIILVFIFTYFYLSENRYFIIGKSHLKLTNTIAAAIVCIVCESFFSNPFHCSPIFILFVILIAGLRGESRIFANRYYLKFIKILIIIVGCLFVKYGYGQWKAEKKWKNASILAKFGSFQQANILYSDAYSVMKNDGRFLYNYGAESADAGFYELSVLLLERAVNYHSFSNLYTYLGNDYIKLKQYSKAEQSYLKAIKIMPSSILPKYQLIQLYILWGRKTDARHWLAYTLNYPVKIKNYLGDAILRELSTLRIE